MKLISPSVAYFKSYQEALAEFTEKDISGFWKFFGPANDAETYIQKIQQYEHEAGLEKGMVPASIFWLIDEEEFVGHVSIRHELNDFLKRVGGHIGYAIRPSAHRKGYGSNILKLALPHAKTLGIKEALVTCDEINIASRKIIEKNGGVFREQIGVEGKLVLHFLIKL